MTSLPQDIEIVDLPHPGLDADPTLGDEVMMHMPQTPLHAEVDSVEFARALSRVLLKEARLRGEDDACILDVYISPTVGWLACRAEGDPLRCWNGVDLTTEEGEAQQERYRLLCDRAYRSLVGRTKAGQLAQLFYAGLDLYEDALKAKRNWRPIRKHYIETMTPVYRYVAGENLDMLRELIVSSNYQMLVTMSSGPFCIGGFSDEERIIVLPGALKRRMKGYLSRLPHDVEDRYHEYILSALTLIDIVL